MGQEPILSSESLETHGRKLDLAEEAYWNTGDPV